MEDLNKSVDTSKYAGVVLLLLIIVGGFVIGAYLSQNDNEDKLTPIGTPSEPIRSSLTYDLYTTDNLEIIKTDESIDDAGYKHILVSVTNNGADKEGVILQATLFDAAKNVLGTELGTIQSIKNSETKVADILIYDSNKKNYSKFKVDINSSY